jgi:glycosyltransferase involved in cell wall biosynthesis
MGVKVLSHLRFPWSPTKGRKLLFGLYDRVIAISDYVAGELDKAGVSREKVDTVHDGIDIGLFEKNRTPSSDIFREFGIPSDAPVICEIGNLRRWKGQHIAIEAVRLLVENHRELRLFLIGEISNSEMDVEYLKTLKELTRRYGLERNIIFTGYRKDALNILSQSDIMVHTSIFPEPLGRVILEGMIFRKPVIATNHGGPVETIEDGISGFLVEPGNPAALAGKISFLLENRDLAKKVGENARAHVEEKFGIRSNVKKIEEIYDSLWKSS